MIFRMKIEKGCLYSERYRVQHCFSRNALELSNINYIIDVLVNYRHLINAVELHDESEIEILNKIDGLLSGIKIENKFEKSHKNEETQNQDTKVDDVVAQNDVVLSDEDTNNTKGRRTKKGRGGRELD
ncbi:MAG: hypothetical protein QW255_05335 [Candidatus Bilamarchaeaceae archaeon]